MTRQLFEAGTDKPVWIVKWRSYYVAVVAYNQDLSGDHVIRTRKGLEYSDGTHPEPEDGSDKTFLESLGVIV